MSEIELIIVDEEYNGIDADCFLRIKERFSGERKDLFSSTREPGIVSFSIADSFAAPEFLGVLPRVDGFWASVFEEPDGVEDHVCPRLEIAPGLQSWWSRWIGLDVENPNRGTGVKIAVVDCPFKLSDGIEHIQARFVDVGADIASEKHGEAVCRIIGDRSAPVACAPIAPGSTIFAYDATFSDSGKGKAYSLGDRSREIDPVKVTMAVYKAVCEDNVDILNLSLGSTDESVRSGSGLEAALRYAVDSGVAVVCAAGNEPTENIAFPASLDCCLAVGALGNSDWGAEFSASHWYARSVDDRRQFSDGSMSLYLWSESAFGAGLDCAVPGVGIVVARSGRPAFDVSGTSFAAPIAAGIVANYLEQLREIVNHDEQVTAADALETLLSDGSGAILTGRLPRELSGSGLLTCMPRNGRE